MKTSLIASLAVILLAGCATPRPAGPIFSPSPAPSSELATVYIYRPNTPPYLRKPDIEINSMVVAELPPNTYTVVHLRPGTYEVKTNWGWDGYPLNKSTTLTVELKGSYYVEVANTITSIGYIGIYHPRISSMALAEPPPAIASCSLVPALQVDVVPK